MSETTAVPDPLAAELAAIRECAERELAAWKLSPVPEAGIHMSAHDTLRLVAAVEAVLNAHSPDLTEPVPHLCKGDPFVWPCPTYRAISAALTGEGATP